jgi:hypothetical protein
MAKKHEVCGGIIPFRCFGDRRLTRLHFRVLGVIATHDRLSIIKGGQGCWAGQKRIDEAVGTGKSHVSEATSDLTDWGYLTAEKGGGEARKVYRVIYSTGDWSSFGVEPGEVPPGGNFKGREVPENRREVPVADCQVIDDIEEPRPNKGINRAEALKNSAEAVLRNEEKDFDFDFDADLDTDFDTEPHGFTVVSGGRS